MREYGMPLFVLGHVATVCLFLSQAPSLAQPGGLSVSGTISSGNSITIDGTTDTITAATGTISFDDENLRTTGTTTTNALTVSGLDCTNNANGGALTANESGVVSCSDDNGALFQTPGDPISVLSSLTLSTQPQSIHVSGRYVYVLTMGGLEVIDVSDSDSPKQVGNLPSVGNAQSLHVSGRYAYLSSNSELIVVDVSNPSSPSRVGSWAAGLYARALQISGSYAYVAGTSNNLLIVDISNASEPVVAGTVVLAGSNIRSIVVSGRYAYLAGTNKFEIVDVSDPNEPSLVGNLDSPGGQPESMAMADHYVYVVDFNSNDLKIIDVSNPNILGVASSLPISGPRSVHVTGRYAYVVSSGSGELKIIDVSNPSMPSEVGSMEVGDSPSTVYVSGRYAYVIDSASFDLKTVDISGAEATSVIIHSLEVGDLQVRNGIVSRGQLQVTDGINAGAGGMFSDGDIGVNGNIYVTGDLVVGGSCAGCISDRRLKRNIHAISGSLERLNTLKPISFDWINSVRENHSDPSPQLGLIAEDVEAVFPELVGTDSRGYKYVRYQKLVAPLIEAVKELAAQKDEEIAELKAENRAIKQILCLAHPQAELCR